MAIETVEPANRTCRECGEVNLHLTSCSLWDKSKPERRYSPVLDSERVPEPVEAMHDGTIRCTCGQRVKVFGVGKLKAYMERHGACKAFNTPITGNWHDDPTFEPSAPQKDEAADREELNQLRRETESASLGDRPHNIGAKKLAQKEQNIASAIRDNAAFVYANTIKLAIEVIKNEATIDAAVRALEVLNRANAPTSAQEPHSFNPSGDPLSSGLCVECGKTEKVGNHDIEDYEAAASAQAGPELKPKDDYDGSELCRSRKGHVCTSLCHEKSDTHYEPYLKPCPFCKFHPTDIDKGSFKKSEFSPMVVLRHWCGDKARKIEIALPTADAVVKVWNTRVTPTPTVEQCLRAEIERLKSHIADLNHDMRETEKAMEEGYGIAFESGYDCAERQ